MPTSSCKTEQGGFIFPCPSETGKEQRNREIGLQKGSLGLCSSKGKNGSQGRLVEAGLEMLQEVGQGQGWSWDHLHPNPAVGLQPYKHIQAHSLELTVDIEEQSGMEEPTMDASAAGGAQSTHPKPKMEFNSPNGAAQEINPWPGRGIMHRVCRTPRNSLFSPGIKGIISLWKVPAGNAGLQFCVLGQPPKS